MGHIPRLEVLNLQLGEMAILPDSFLANAAQLASLTLEANYINELSSGFLASLPQLSRLDKPYHLHALPDSFMARAPRLQQLCLLAESLARVPALWLSNMPGLSEGGLYLFRIYKLAPDISCLRGAYLQTVSDPESGHSTGTAAGPIGGTALPAPERLLNHGKLARYTECSQEPGRTAGQSYRAGIRDIRYLCDGMSKGCHGPTLAEFPSCVSEWQYGELQAERPVDGGRLCDAGSGIVQNSHGRKESLLWS